MRVLINFIVAFTCIICSAQAIYAAERDNAKKSSGTGKASSKGEVTVEVREDVEVEGDLSLEGDVASDSELDSDTSADSFDGEEVEEEVEAVAEEVEEEVEMTVTIAPAPETPAEMRARIRRERLAEKQAEREDRIRLRKEAVEHRLAEREAIRQARYKEAKARQDRMREKHRQYWETHKHPPGYFNWLLFGGGIVEDGDNRLTTNDDQVMQSIGMAFRIGATLNDMHMVGVRLQSMVRPTKNIKRDRYDDDGDWGSVMAPFIGPEYRFLTRFGLYVGASVGAGALLAVSDGDCDYDDYEDDPYYEDWDYDCDGSDTRGAVSLGGMLNVGYLFRLRRYFSMNLEAFGGYFHGFDSGDERMRNAIFGIGLGFGV